MRIFLSSSRDVRVAAVRAHLAGTAVRAARSPAEWPFRRDIRPPRDNGPSTIWIRDLHQAFPAGQTAGTRLVLTQSTYQLQRWLDWLDATGSTVVADADGAELRRSSPEAAAGRGPWSRIEVVDLDAGRAAARAPVTPDSETPTLDQPSADLLHQLHDAFTQPDPGLRLDACRRAVIAAPDDPAFHLALASACMEIQALDDAASAIAKAASLAPDWEAVHFEAGKLYLRVDDTERAAEAFAEAARLMPHFAAALLNLGGALGELGRHDEALDVLRQARAVDPRSHTIVNNIGTALRESGRFDEAAAAFREVIALAPAFVFGYYNLGHTLLMAGDVRGAREAYEQGFGRDAQRNARQACRLAITRAATGDAEGALLLLRDVRANEPGDRAAELFEEAESALGALSAVPGMDALAIGTVLDELRRYSS